MSNVHGWSYLISCLLVCIAGCFSNAEGNRPYIDHPTCPRRYDLLAQTPTRICMRKCLTDANCNGRPHRKCLCDGACGKSCVKWRNRCPPLQDIEDGTWQLVNADRAFGAVVRYSCNSGFILTGPAERVCRADGEWSGVPPTCETEGKCHEPPIVENAVHDGNASQKLFPLGTQLTYRCKNGYHVDGVFLAMCVGNGRWIGPRIKCSPRRCGHPGEIPNGYRNGSSTFVYPNRVTYSCLTGFELVGPPYRVCQTDGTWSGELPECRPISCSRLVAPTNGHIEGNDSSAIGSVVKLSCDPGFRLVGSPNRRCLRNGTWSGTTTRCTGVDCGEPGPFPNGHFIGGLKKTGVGTVIEFRCDPDNTMVGTSHTSTCLPSGHWSHAPPICLGRCKIPMLTNGSCNVIGKTTAAGSDYVKHGVSINCTCGENFVDAIDDIVTCTNGSWNATPACLPAPCRTRPKHDFRNGMIRLHTMNHGDHAVHHCDPGYQLNGTKYIVCEFGKWKTPDGDENITVQCVAKDCAYPGHLNNGSILLIGVTSKHEYKHYIKHVRHNEQIIFQCDKEFRLRGPSGATCVDGEWSPQGVPKCIPKQYPNEYYVSRGRRHTYARKHFRIAHENT